MNTHDKEMLSPLFWDIDVETLDLKNHRSYVIDRILKFGRPAQVRWLLSNYSEEDVVERVKHSKRIDRKTASYWAIHYKIPREDIVCFQRQLIQPCFY